MKELELTSWSEFKDICITRKNLNCQFTETAEKYELYGPDANGIVWHTSFLKADPRQGDQVEFEDSYKVTFNWAIGNRPYSFSTPDFDFKGDASFDTCTAGQTKDIDYTFSEELYVNGGNVVLSDSIVGDWVEVHVVHPTYGAIKTYITKRYVPASPTGQVGSLMEIKTPYAGKIPAGLKLRLTYHSTGSVDVKVAINYDLHKAI